MGGEGREGSEVSGVRSNPCTAIVLCISQTFVGVWRDTVSDMKTILLTTIIALGVSMPVAHFAQAADVANVVKSPETGAAVDGKFIESVAQGNLAEIELSEQAKDRSKRDDVKHFARTMIKDHTDVKKNLKTLTDRMNIDLPKEANIEQRAVISRMKEAADQDFDKMYADVMVADHSKMVALFEDFSKNATNADLKAFADNTLPGLKTHLDHAKNLATAVGAPSASK
jgi:putative membrane protein